MSRELWHFLSAVKQPPSYDITYRIAELCSLALKSKAHSCQWRKQSLQGTVNNIYVVRSNPYICCNRQIFYDCI